MARSVVYYVACSADGFIADAEGGVDWLGEFQGAGTDFGYAEFLGGVGDAVMGRHTYEQLLGFDAPYPYADLPVWVMSSDTSLAATTGSVTITDEPAEGLVARLKYSEAPGIVWLVGGGRLAGSLFHAGLVDELRVFVLPVTLGAGVRLLGSGGGARRLERTLVAEWPLGVVEIRYAVRESLER